jgi:hypothetical protein
MAAAAAKTTKKQALVHAFSPPERALANQIRRENSKSLTKAFTAYVLAIHKIEGKLDAEWKGIAAPAAAAKTVAKATKTAKAAKTGKPKAMGAAVTAA